MLGAAIQFVRRTRKMTQAELAEKVGVSIPTISRIETETQDFTTAQLFAIAQALQVTPEELISRGRDLSVRDVAAIFGELKTEEETV